MGLRDGREPGRGAPPGAVAGAERNGRAAPKVPLLLAALAICAVGALSYANSLSGQFLWDDLNFISRNVLIRDWANLPKVFLSDPGETSGEWYGFYRPLQTVTYMVNYSLGGYRVGGYHAFSVLFHVLASLALWRFCALVSGVEFIGLAAGLLYVANPLHVESVAYLSGRADSLAFLFMLLSLISYVRLDERSARWRHALPALFFALALLSKENSVVLPALALLYHAAFRKRVRWPPFLSLVAVGALYALARLTLLRSILSRSSSFADALERVPGVFAAIAGYAKRLLLPVNLHPAYGEGTFSFADPPVLAGMAATLLLVGAALWFRRSNRLLLFAVFWFFVSLAPVSNLVKVVYYMADHYLYVPSLGFFLVVGQALNAVHERRRRAGLAALALLVAASGFRTARQNELWREPVSFFERTIAAGGSSWQLYLHLGDLYRERREYEKARDLYRRAIELRPDGADSHANMGHTLYLEGKAAEAAKYFGQAIGINPAVPQYHNNLGVCYRDMGLAGKAAESFGRAIELNPYEAQYYLNLADIHYRAGRVGETLALLERSLSYNRGDARVHSWLAEIYARAGEERRSKLHRDLAASLASR